MKSSLFLPCVYLTLVMIISAADDEAPTLNCSDIKSTTDLGLNSSSDVDIMPYATDNVDTDPNVTCSHSSKHDFLIGITTVTCSSTDNAENTGNCTFLVKVTDDEAPTLDCSDITSTTDFGLNSSSDVDIMAYATDNVDTDPNVTCSYSSDHEFLIGITTVTCSSTDNAENTGNCTFLVTVTDDEAPTLDCSDITSTTDLGLNSSSDVDIMPYATDNVDTDPNVTCSHSSDHEFLIGITTVTCSSTDNAENTGNCTFLVTVTDDEAPTLDCSDITSTTDLGLNSSSDVDIMPYATDNVDSDPNVTCSHSSDHEFLIGITTVTCSSTDNAENTGNCTFLVTVTDDEAPTLNCSDITSTTDLGLNSSSDVDIMPYATDNVDTDPNVTCSYSSDHEFLIGITTVTCSSTDNAENTGNCTFLVTVTDDEAPTLNCSDITFTTDFGLNSSSDVDIMPYATDNADADPNVTCSHSSKHEFLIGITTVTCSSTDNAENTGNCTFLVTVTDDEAPTLNCSDITSTTDFGLNSSSDVDIMPYATDNVDTDPDVTCSHLSDHEFLIGITTVTCSSTDNAENTGNCTFLFTVTDDEAPTLNCSDITFTTDFGLNSSSDVDIMPYATDNADADPNVTCSHSSKHEFLIGITTVTCSSTDNAENTGNCTFLVTVTDDEAPTLNCSDITSTTDFGLNSSSDVDIMPYATDNVDTDPDVTCSHLSDHEFLIGITTVTCSSTDNAENTGNCTFLVTVTDDEAPTLDCSDITSTTDFGLNSSSDVDIMPYATDNVDTDPNVTCSHSSKHDFLIGITTVNCSSTDNAENTGNCTFLVTVTDDEAPTLNCSDITSTTDLGLNSSSDVDIMPYATDNVDTDPNVTCSYSSDHEFLIGITTVTCSSTDNAENTGNCTFLVTVTDDEAPTLNCSDITSTTDFGLNSSSDVDIMPYATDNVDTDPDVTCSHLSDHEFLIGITTVTCSSTDNAENTGNCTFLVTVTDDEAPTLDCSDITSTTDFGLNSSSDVDIMPYATDNVDTDPNVTCSHSSKHDFLIGITTVNCSSTDNAENTGNCTFLVTVTDDEAPTLNCSDITSTTDLGLNSSSDVDIMPYATDNVDTDPNVTCSYSSDHEFLIGITTVTCSSTDNAENTGNCTFLVTVTDDEAPTLNCSDITSTTDFGLNSSSDVDIMPYATDNVDTDPNVTCSYSSDHEFLIGITTVTCSSTDNAENTGNCTFLVTVTDDEAPTLNCSDITSTTDLGLNSSSDVDIMPYATDNVDTDPDVTCSHLSDHEFLIGITTVTCSSTDNAENTGNCTFLVTVTDDEAPTLNCSDITSTTDLGLNSSSDIDIMPYATDNVDTDPNVTCSHSSKHDFLIGITTVNCSSTDNAENTGNCTFLVTVTDDEAPTLNCSDITSTTDLGLNSSSDVDIMPYATDNVDTDPNVTCSYSSDHEFLIGITTVTCSSTDNAENTGNCTFLVTVTDDEAPTLNCSDITSTTDFGLNSSSDVDIMPYATDNADADPNVTCSHSSKHEFLIGITTVTCSSTDNAENTGNCTFLVTVTDDEAPTLNCSDITSTTDLGLNSSSDVDIMPYATDNVDTDPDVTCSHLSDHEFLIGITTVTCSSTDNAENTGNCTFLVTVTDDEAPTLDCSDITSTTDFGLNLSSDVDIMAYATDNVDTDPNVTCSHSSDHEFLIGITTMTKHLL
ncbi:uncharacterized protein LOC115928569 [Strongylocentrotus purpuratus]|uniref:HYR domain-containing protein n=1 Tax=Strongylocentrotus purpuratus TaxID=7668 RepID=A0A7M7PHD6_STRPU|nr:uncharacterized protein LOC115928569 [Strongylocentrotus purpuratus]